MSENNMENILVMAIFTVTRDDVRACADELGIPVEQVSDDLIDLVKEKVSQGLGDWQKVIKEMVKEIIEEKVIECPLGLVCSPSCVWREVGQCISLREVK